MATEMMTDTLTNMEAVRWKTKVTANYRMLSEILRVCVAGDAQTVRIYIYI
jgi:hypothetical protein